MQGRDQHPVKLLSKIAQVRTIPTVLDEVELWDQDISLCSEVASTRCSRDDFSLAMDTSLTFLTAQIVSCSVQPPWTLHIKNGQFQSPRHSVYVNQQ